MNAQATPKATRKEWLGLIVLALPCLIYSMDLTVLNLAVPKISADLKPSGTELLWMLDIYGFMVAGCLITMGTLGDRIGRRRLLLIGAAFFAVASIIAAFSTSAEMLIATRALLGLAGATVAPSTLSLIRNMFLDARERTVAVSVWVTSYSLGAAIGPPLGGLLLEYFWWGSVFLLAVPVMVLLLIVGPSLLPEYRDPNAGKPDILSTVMSIGAVLALIFGLKHLAEHGLDATALLSIVAGLAIATAFIFRQGRLEDPLIDTKLFRVPAFSASLGIYLVGGVVIFGLFVFMAQYLQLVLGLSPLEAGLWTMPSALAFVVGSMLTPVIRRRFRPALVMAVGLLASSLGFIILTQIDGNSGLGTVMPAFILISLAIGPVFTLTVDLVVGTAPPERAGAASAISETCGEFGGALGIAVLGSIGAAVYRGRMADGVPEGLPAESAEAARNTLGGAVSASESLPAGIAEQLLTSARDAFAQSFEITALVSTALVLVAAALVLLVLRNVEVSGAEEHGIEPTPLAVGIEGD